MLALGGVEEEGREVEAVIVVICRLSFWRRLQVGKLFLQGNLMKQKRTIKRGSAELDFFVNVPKMSSSMNAVYNLIESETLISSIPYCRESLVSFELVAKLHGCRLQFTKYNAWIGIQK